MRGLNCITKKILENNKELNFRISLAKTAKTTLMVESIPREETVYRLAEHLVGEVEQVVHLDLNKKDEPKTMLKRMDKDSQAERALEKEERKTVIQRRMMLAASFLRKEVVRKERCAHGGILWMIRGGAGRAEQRSIWPTSVLDKMERLKAPSRRKRKRRKRSAQDSEERRRTSR